MTKDKNKKTRRTKKSYRFSAQEVAELVGCSVSYVKKLRAGVVAKDSPMAQKVLTVDQVADDSNSLLLNKLKGIIKNK
ncbi:hypothetical protein [Litoribacter populi]|uniref:hypothetical protein n=1 Tax=Litoribacter populi TaxID=2598460 RepID=UPI00117EA265|nr:hypothetical protein [Litoribacter populi]